ncbi:MAG: hypothetical protein AVO35_06910 [Candidatus Aegiribacteria sp. MLS_C]|nr:MAG: hypothetical protein AVO35_06910 [Candidatus Aegiribacteria sp. MLS_C]
MNIAASLLMCLIQGTVLFRDDFDDGDAEGWHEISMVNYDVVGGMYRMYGGYEENHGISFNGDLEGCMSTPDYSVRCRMVPETGVFFGMMCRFSEDTEYRIMLVLSHQHQSLRFYRWDAAGISLLDDAPFTVELMHEYWMRCEVRGDSFRGRAWTGGVSAEPFLWMVEMQDTLSLPGSAALFCAGIPCDRVSMSCRFDDVMVTDCPAGLRQDTWAGIKETGRRTGRR